MRKDYEMITVKEYVEELDRENVVSLKEEEISRQVEKYLLNQKRHETNAKVVEALLA